MKNPHSPLSVWGGQGCPRLPLSLRQWPLGIPVCSITSRLPHAPGPGFQEEVTSAEAERAGP